MRKISIVVIVLVLTSVFLAKSIFQKITKVQDLELRCAQLGLLAKNDFESKYPSREEGFLVDVTYHYNTNLKRCLFAREIHSGAGKGESFNVWKGITDLSSNKEVLYVLRFYSADTPPKIIGDFSAVNYLDGQAGVVIKDETEFESVYNRTMTE